MDRNTSLSAAGTTNATESADVAKEAVADDLLVESRLSRELIETTEKAIMRKERHLDDDEASTEKENKIEVAANRYDLLCLEGPALSLRVFEEIQDIPTYTLVDVHRDSMLKMHVRPETSPLRPYIVCAVLRGITFDEARYNSFIELQDKLHQNICRRRTLVAIGTHDLDTIQGPFTYEALPPDQINFVPLKQERSFRADELMEFYKSDLKLKKFLDIILDSPVYPVIYDSNRTVLSLPPIINGAHSAISLKTKNVFIECTATDLTKAKTVLNTMVTMFSVYCEIKYQVEPVEVIYPDGKSYICPDLSLYDVDVPLSYINDTIGVSLEADEDGTILAALEPDNVTSTNAVCIATELTHVEDPVLPQQPLVRAVTFLEEKVSTTHVRTLKHTQKNGILNLTGEMFDFLELEIPEGGDICHKFTVNFQDLTTMASKTLPINCYVDRKGKRRPQIPARNWRDITSLYDFGLENVNFEMEIVNLTTVGFRFTVGDQTLQPVVDQEVHAAAEDQGVEVVADQDQQVEAAEDQQVVVEAAENQDQQVEAAEDQQVEASADQQDAAVGTTSFRLFGQLIVAPTPPL